MTYVVTAPSTPGATPTTQATCGTLREARREARSLSCDRADLAGQDVRIERADGSLVEYAGTGR